MTDAPESAKWVAPVVAVGTFFAIAGTIAVCVVLYYSGRLTSGDAHAERGVLVVRCSDAAGEPIENAWLIVESFTDRRVPGRDPPFVKTIGQSAVLSTDAGGNATIPAAINTHANLDIRVWADGYRVGSYRRFVREDVDKTDMFVERGGADPSRALPPGTVATIRLVETRDRDAERARMRHAVGQIVPRRLHDASRSVEDLNAALTTP